MVPPPHNAIVISRAWPSQTYVTASWASYVQVPADIWLGKHAGTDLLMALGFQVMWAVVLLAACQGVLGLATRKVVVQGG